MVSNIVSYSILLLYLLPCASWSQGNDVDLSLEQSLDLLHKENKSLKIAGKEVEWARNEHQKLNAFWYPSVNAAGAFVHMSNPIEVRQSLSKYKRAILAPAAPAPFTTILAVCRYWIRSGKVLSRFR